MDGELSLENLQRQWHVRPLNCRGGQNSPAVA
jgi:hypothetical protein